jgi:hypothetical protein
VKEVAMMRKTLPLVAAMAVASMLASVPAVDAGPQEAGKENATVLRKLSLEFVGQFLNSPPPAVPVTHEHYGYVSYIRGVQTFRAAPQDETTALFTFFATGDTLRVISDGPLRVVTRVGTVTVYRDLSTNGNFTDPSTFRDGTPVLVARFRQQAILNTVTNATSVFHQDAITSTAPFDAGGRRVQLGTVGEAFTTHFSGQTNMPGPPSGYIAGYAVTGSR